MFSFARLAIIMLFISSVTVGGVGVQQGDSLFMKGGAGLLVVAVVLLIVYKIIWKALGCLIVLGIIAAGVMLGMQSIGVDGASSIESFKTFFSSNTETEETEEANTEDQQEEDTGTQGEMSSGEPVPDNEPVPETGIVIDTSESEVQGPAVNFSPDLVGDFIADPQPEEVRNTNNRKKGKGRKLASSRPREQEQVNQVPQIAGLARIINGDTIQIDDKIIRMFGIDAPEPSQICAKRSGSSYRCGQKAAQELRNMLGNSTVTCSIMQQNDKGHVIGTCSVGPYDVGAAMVSAGWAVAYREFSTVYVPYEDAAKQQEIGLWEGEFYMPWDWREQSRQKIKTIVTERPSSGGNIMKKSRSLLGLF